MQTTNAVIIIFRSLRCIAMCCVLVAVCGWNMLFHNPQYLRVRCQLEAKIRKPQIILHNCSGDIYIGEASWHDMSSIFTKWGRANFIIFIYLTMTKWPWLMLTIKHKLNSISLRFPWHGLFNWKKSWLTVVLPQLCHKKFHFVKEAVDILVQNIRILVTLLYCLHILHFYQFRWFWFLASWLQTAGDVWVSVRESERW